MKLNADDPRIQAALVAWHEAERADFDRQYHNLNYDTYAPKFARPGKRWIKLNRGTSGVYLVDTTSPDLCVYSIKAYGVPNRLLGSLDSMVTAWRTP